MLFFHQCSHFLYTPQGYGLPPLQFYLSSLLPSWPGVYPTSELLLACMFVKKKGDFHISNVYLTSLKWFYVVIQYCAKLSSHLSFLCFAQEMGNRWSNLQFDTCVQIQYIRRKKTVYVILTTLRQVCIWEGFTKQSMNERTDTSVKSFLRSQLEFFLFPKDFEIVFICC